ncbi:MAG TPA: 2-C-methyl-D-erythritol 2,4-cyclodiphosphate synthase [Trueperaceae bacterium]|nr:2-C-methyl-D-erythritol 2,4-cyclodiphosphate synthase [Trueperaceae bacterium]
MQREFRVGHGQDAHRLAGAGPLLVGGVSVESPRGALAHSDGDVLLHALADALLSAYALGDIGRLFPPTDPGHAGLDSREIVARALDDLHRHVGAVRIENVAAVVTLDAPKLGPRREEIAASVAGLLGITPDAVGLTFKTSEGMAPDHVQASVTLLLSR